MIRLSTMLNSNEPRPLTTIGSRCAVYGSHSTTSYHRALSLVLVTIPLVLCLATSANSLRDRLTIPSYSAASESQIRFAIENNYDDTGPGAKGPESAYNTYSTLEEALVSYIDDPDTKLPESERMKAILRLINTPKDYERYNPSQAIRELPKSVAEYTGYRNIPTIAPIVLKKQPWHNNQVLYHDPRTNMGIYDLRGISVSNINSVKPRERPQNLYKLEDIHIPGQVGQVNSLPVPNYYPYLTKFIPAQSQYESNPQHSYSYGHRVSTRLTYLTKQVFNILNEKPGNFFTHEELLRLNGP
ncbi:hypothetical protein RR46_07344 [Papilio xuthus]|uniref:Uncharacterized protein n=1 Tax=Papilio xuthus TaxID=66420 RepID=A0A194PW96_PAPXU|nr:hypothetical protein RR46_07344 [Papilio xuthus]